MPASRVRAKRKGQAVVEFGIVALTFTLLVFAVVDLGMLLNSWVRISSGVREVARGITVGDDQIDVTHMVQALVLPGVSQNVASTPFAGYCCGENGANDKIVVSVAYYPGDCIPSPSNPCAPVPKNQVKSIYWDGTCTGTCPHPARGDIVVVSLAAPGMEVITPLVRPFFGCSGTSPHCFVRLGSTAMMRYEGQ